MTLSKVIETEAAEKKLEKGIRDGRVHRFHGCDWFQEAVDQNVISAEEAELLKETEALVERVIAVDHFDAAELVPHYRSDSGGDSDNVESIAAAE